jgi:hypothetical protein
VAAEEYVLRLVRVSKELIFVPANRKKACFLTYIIFYYKEDFFENRIYEAKSYLKWVRSTKMHSVNFSGFLNFLVKYDYDYYYYYYYYYYY